MARARRKRVKGDRPQYSAYIESDIWRQKGKRWLRESHYRCAMFPWIVIGRQHKGRYRPYRIHHTHYGTLGREVLWRDVVPLSRVAHDWVIHGVLSGFRSAGQQRHYPNAAQRVAHLWCRLPVIVKIGLGGLLAMGAIGLVVGLGLMGHRAEPSVCPNPMALGCVDPTNL